MDPIPSQAAPAAFVDRPGALRMFGVAPTTWKRWQRAGRVPLGQWASVPGTRARRRVYNLAELQRLLDEFLKRGQPYPDPDRPGCWRLPAMSFTTTRCEAIIDAESVPLVAGKWWNLNPRADGYPPAFIHVDADGRRTIMHYIILGLDPARWRITHANGDPLDCRRSNLLVRDLSQHSAAARKAKTYRRQPCSSRFKGVAWQESRGKWVAMITKDKQHRFLGRFDDEVDAAKAYDHAARDLFGPHARLNFPDDEQPAFSRAA